MVPTDVIARKSGVSVLAHLHGALPGGPQLLHTGSQSFGARWQNETVFTMFNHFVGAARIAEREDRLTGVERLQGYVAIGVLVVGDVQGGVTMRHQVGLFLLGNPAQKRYLVLQFVPLDEVS